MITPVHLVLLTRFQLRKLHLHVPRANQVSFIICSFLTLLISGKFCESYALGGV
jgi:hypothetical protein